MALSGNLGFPRIGAKRELKKATESYWKGELSGEELKKAGSELRKANWQTQKEAGIDLIPSNDFSFYDQMLDMSCLLGNVPPRFKWDGNNIDLDVLFLMARGSKEEGSDHASQTFACEMTKWFDTNYHYIVPEFSQDTNFKISSSKIFDEFQEALDAGIKTKPVLIGPLTYLTLGKIQDKDNPNFDRFELFGKLLPLYVEILQKLEAQGAEWVQIDEPVLSLDLTDEQRSLAKSAFETFASSVPNLKILAANYFGDLRDNLQTFLGLPVNAFHVDCVRAAGELDQVLSQLPADKLLSVGVVDGRNIWKNDFEQSLAILEKAKAAIGEDRLIVSPSCSLVHSPVTLRNEAKLDDELKNWLAFAEEKLTEVTSLFQLITGQGGQEALEANKAANESRRSSSRIHNNAVKDRSNAVTEADLKRDSEFTSRQTAQREKIKLPLFPTTTIGSFPQTKEVRSNRAKLKKGELSAEDYDTFVKDEIKKAVDFQEEVGIDMFVHGEFERNDMVEYFGENLEGFAFTQFGWVQSYGSRYVKPPVIFGDVSRPKPMTVYYSSFAQTLTDKPMKGMLTGPVTILQWSFVRNDQPRSETAKQIGLAIRDEVQDLEAANIAAIQIDEPALREGLPLRRDDWKDYLKWAVDAFRLCSSGVKDDTQIHTHMCYAEFNDIIQAIADLDADVISIETSRSNMELLEAFVNFKYPNEVGPGVFDIHSPRVPEVTEMDQLLQKAEDVLPIQNIWVNPDCGLKTRQWPEVKEALKNMVLSAKNLRESQSAAKS